MTEVEAARLVREERLRQRLTQEQLAVRAGVVKATIQKIEAARSVRVRTLRDVLRALGLPLDEPSGVVRLSDDDVIRLVQQRYGLDLRRLIGPDPNPPAAGRRPELTSSGEPEADAS